jgi:tetraacyldisaccharide 4'-kinase
MTAWLARWLGKKNLKVAIISRGYGKIPYRNTDDEDVLLDVEMENVVRLRGVNKILLAKRALREYGADILILDDGFQHIRIKRDLDIVLIDATDPFSNYKLIPRGLLREKPTSLSRADILILTRTDQVKPQDLNLLEDRIKKMGYKGPILQSIHRPVYAWSFYDRRIVDLGSLRRRQWYAFCGLGNPKAFIQTLSSYNIPLVRYHLFPDHHVYTQLELQRLVAEAQEFMADAMLTTEKDAKRIPHPWALPMELFVLKVELEITQGEQILFGVLNDLVKDLQHIAITAT